MRRLIAAAVVVFVFSSLSQAQQHHGMAPPVISFGGNFRGFTPGIPASVTSQGSIGSAVGDANFPPCCINPLFPLSSTPLIGRRHRFDGLVPIFYGGYSGGYGGSPVIIVQQSGSGYDEEDGGGPTIFDRRGPGSDHFRDYGRNYERAARRQERERYEDQRDDRDSQSREMESHAQVQELAPAIQPRTVLVFRDGHQEEIGNYAIVGDQLFDFGEVRRKIEIAALDVPATVKANDARGLDFALPAGKR